MNLIGARRCIAASVKFILLAALASVPCSPSQTGDCDRQLGRGDRIARFKDLDQKAESAMRARRFSDALELYKEAVCLVPDSARGFYGRGMAAAAVRDFVLARDSFQTADRLQPNTPMPLIMQVRVNLSLADMDALKANLRDAALRFPADPNAHATLARFLSENDLLMLALAEALRSGQANSRDSASRLQLAGLENTVGAYDDAARNAASIERDSAASEPVRAAAAGIAGLSYESLGNTDLATQFLKESITLDSSRENSYLALADLFDQMKKYGDAAEVLTQARTRLPDSEPVLLALGTDLIRTEHYADGIAVLRAMLKKFPETFEAYIGLADAARKMGDSNQELQMLQDLARRNPDYPMVHVLIARGMLGREPIDLRSVLSELAVAEKQSAADPDIFYLRGKAYIASGRYADALAPLRRSIELRALDPGPYYQLAKVYQKLGKSDLAQQQFDHVKYLESTSQNQ